MRLASFKIGQKRAAGLVIGQPATRIADLTDILAGQTDLIPVIENPEKFSLVSSINEHNFKGEIFDLASVGLLPPIARPGKIICLAGNYTEHISESGYKAPQDNSVFTQQLFLKPSTSLIGCGAVIELGSQNVRVGWETELAVVIGKGGRNIPASSALEHVFGYTVLNDISERGLNSQVPNRHRREMDEFCDWLAGKWFDGFAPCGPWIVTSDEVKHPHELTIRFFLNGEERQHGSTLDMIFDIPSQIEYISSIMTLEAGDIISTGTPAGAGVGDKRTTLADGDELVSEIERIGKLINTVRYVN
ncbi:MAG: fumarylacetoacetate hydrolase family protein [Acidobacteriota bacterium]